MYEMNLNPNLLVVLGPTASGKTRLGVELCRKLNGEVISADSRQVYRGMDIGTGKDLAEYGDIPYHLIDIAEPGYEFNLFEFQRLFYAAFENIRQRQRLPVLVGGTGLYLDAALRGYRLVEVPPNPQLRAELAPLSDEELTARLLALKPEQHNTTDTINRERLIRAIEIGEGENNPQPQNLPPAPELSPLIFGIRWERKELIQRIETRLRQRLDEGMIEEVANLHDNGVPYPVLESYGLEYRFVALHLQDKLNRNDLVQQLASAIRAFAKRQMTWFRRMERHGVLIHWLDPADDLLSQALTIFDRTQP
ncbi:MAG: tRNA (adenosine(37)-N6)-dimethylallyltransferase MiaA [Deltaproteobacteria bacterium]|nr:tRNA (adenosine(37)-N6)-dimethylallyltransferase MiaA [Deltaproteobacteria bacterium]